MRIGAITMRERLPIELENLELPQDNYMDPKPKSSYGFANILYLLGMIITMGSVLVVMLLGNR